MTNVPAAHTRPPRLHARLTKASLVWATIDRAAIDAAYKAGQTVIVNAEGAYGMFLTSALTGDDWKGRTAK